MKFYDAVFPLHLVSKLFGFTIFSVDRNGNLTRFAKKDVVIIIVTAAIVTYIMTEFIKGSFSFPAYYQSHIIQMGLPVLYYGKYFINLLSILWSLAMRNKIAKLLIRIQNVDEEVRTD